jgi:hypothetical protein
LPPNTPRVSAPSPFSAGPVTQLIFQWDPWILPSLMFVVLALAIELPYRFGKWAQIVSEHIDAFTAVQTGLLTLASFVLGISFGQASERFDVRRELVVKEANAIGTTWLRADQLAPRDASRFRRILTAYTAARLRAYQTPRNQQVWEKTVAFSDDSQAALWNIASGALRRQPGNLGLSLLMETLNDTIDISAEQLQALTVHVPTQVVALTLVLVTLGALSLGLRFGVHHARPAALSLVYIIASVVVISMMIDYDRPQSGFIRVNLNPIRAQLQSMQQSQ